MARPVSPDEVRRIAALARIAVDDARLASLAAELNTILEHMDVLREVDTEGEVAAAGLGAGGTPLREDGGTPVALVHPLQTIAPRMRHGLFLVPRLASHDGIGSGAPEEA